MESVVRRKCIHITFLPHRIASRILITMYDRAYCRFLDAAQVYLAQSLYKAGLYPEATRAAVRVDSPQYQQRMIALQVRFDG